ncbi:histidine phosphatase family protein [Tropicimonas aquimaris]|uniref:Histidine phosphatase family protein n=1 Tax=Tropicimonas aquimaris TaxID=914152 RepID=A0ABW3IRT8_9RHOB
MVQFAFPNRQHSPDAVLPSADAMPEFYILRHGETHWNVSGRMQGRLDSPLTALGREQAVRQGHILRVAGAGRLPLLCSPSGRALATAALALPGRAPMIDDRLGEIGMGNWQGLTREEIFAGRPELADDPHPFLWKFSAPGGETVAQMQTRIAEWVSERREPAIVVTHGVTSQFLRGALLGIDVAAMSGLEDCQGVVYRVAHGRQERLETGC